MIKEHYLQKLLQIAKSSVILRNSVGHPLGPVALHRTLPLLFPCKINLTHDRTEIS